MYPLYRCISVSDVYAVYAVSGDRRCVTGRGSCIGGLHQILHTAISTAIATANRCQLAHHLSVRWLPRTFERLPRSRIKVETMNLLPVRRPVTCHVQRQVRETQHHAADVGSKQAASARVAGVQPLCKLTLAGTSLLIGNCFTYL